MLHHRRNGRRTRRGGPRRRPPDLLRRLRRHLAGVDNGRQESAERYQASTRTAYHGKALAIVRTGTKPGHLTITARSTGLRKATTTLRTTGGTPTRVTPTPPFTPDPARPHPPTRSPTPATRDRPHTARGHAGRRPGHRLVQRLHQARHRTAPRLQRGQEDRLGLGDLGRKRRVRRIEVSFTLDTTHPCPPRSRSPPGTDTASPRSGGRISPGPTRPANRPSSPSTRCAPPGSVWTWSAGTPGRPRAPSGSSCWTSPRPEPPSPRR